MQRKSPRPAARARYQRGPHLYLRKGVWYARGGKLGRAGVSLKTSDRDAAGERLADILARRPVVPDAAPAQERTFDALTKEWLSAPLGYTRRTKETAEQRIGAWCAWMHGRGVTLPSQVTATLVDDWIRERGAAKTEGGKGGGVSRGTINRDLRVAKKCFRWAAKRGLCARVAAVEDREELREPVRHLTHVVPSPAEMGRILGAMKDGRHRAAVACLWLTGQRVEELRHMHAASLRAGGLYVEPEAGAAAEAWESKGYRTRVIPLGETAQKAVRQYLAVAVGARGKHTTARCLLTHLHHACAAAKLPRCGLHDLRRAFATEAHRAGVPMVTIAAWLGHADVRTTEGYLAAYRTDRTLIAPTPEGADIALTSAAAPGATVIEMRPTAAEGADTVQTSGAPGGAESARSVTARRGAKR